MARAALTLALALSGASALIYEIVWTRQLALLMGHTVAAATCVLAAFMLGLAGGASIGARLAARFGPQSSLRAYAGLEILIAALALLIPVELTGFRPLLAWAYGEAGGTAFDGVRFVVALVVVALPALAMGATLPLIVHWRSGAFDSAARETAWWYAWNTAGAAAGAWLCGFVLLPAVGMRQTTWIAAGANLCAAALAVWAVRGARSAGRAEPRRADVQGEPPKRFRVTAMAALAISGAVSLVLQIVWTRILSLVLGPTTYAFSLMLTVFIAGIAIGAAAGGWVARRRSSPRALAAALLFAGITSLSAAVLVPQVTLAVADVASSANADFSSILRFQALLIAIVMLPMTIAFGAAFPLAVGMVTGPMRGIAASLAALYAANTLGAIAGALAAGYVLIPAVGLQGSVRVAAGVCAGAAASVFVIHAESSMHRWTGGLLAGVVAAGIWLVPKWDQSLLSSGAYKYAAYLPVENRSAILRAGELLYYREGAASTVSVREAAGTRTLAIDGKVDASNAGDMLTQRLLAHVPLLLHAAPRYAAIVGLGSGVTLGSALRHPVEQIDTIEISPQVVEAAALFSAEHGNALADPRSRIIVGDGRTHLLFGRQRYDVIVSEPSNPWIAGVAGLFTREMFVSARARLATGGIVCQWAHVYDMSAEDLRSIVSTFVDVFPHALLFAIGDNDVLLVGAEERLELRLSAVEQHWSRPGVAADLSAAGVIRPELLLSLLVADSASLRGLARSGDIQRDDRMALEFSGPASAFGRASVSRPGLFREVRLDPETAAIIGVSGSAGLRRDRGLMLLQAESFDAATTDLLVAVETDASDATAVDGLLRAAGPAGRLQEAEQLLRRLTGANPTQEAPAIGLSRLLASRGSFADAAEVIRPIVSDSSARSLEQLASVFADGRDPRLGRVVSGLERLLPRSDTTTYFSAVLALTDGRPRDAITLLRHIQEQGRAGFRELTLLGSAYDAAGYSETALETFKTAVTANPREPAGYENLGTAALTRGDYRRAAGCFAEALLLDGSSPVARRGLATALERLR